MHTESCRRLLIGGVTPKYVEVSFQVSPCIRCDILVGGGSCLKVRYAHLGAVATDWLP